jgi:Trk K+ transport system NAD-binding subunit
MRPESNAAKLCQNAVQQMKTLAILIAAYFTSRRSQRNLRVLVGLLALLTAIIVVYSVLFHVIMLREGQDHSWLTGTYWTVVAMSTLGFGDVTFHSDLGRMFSVVVVLSGMIFMLILLPFTFIQFFYAPWLEARDKARTPSELPASMRDHVLLASHGPIEAALIERLDRFHTPYAVIVPDLADALALHDDGVSVMVGELDDPQTYRRARVEQAALVATTLADTTNANVIATVRECTDRVPVVSSATSADSVDILELAGSQEVLQMGKLLGQAMARRVFGRDGRSHVAGHLDDLLIAEAAAAHTPLVGRTLGESALRERFGVNVAGVWERGRYALGTADTKIMADSLLVLSGTRQQLDAYNDAFGLPEHPPESVVIIGGGRVGRAAAAALVERGIDHTVVEKVPGRVPGPSRVVVGDAADLEVLKEAGIDHATSALVTTHFDDVNVYLTLYCRRLQPDMLILSRSTRERNTGTLHRAGADLVLSYASIGANAVFNVLRDRKLLFLTEGLDVFTVPVPPSLAGLTLANSKVRGDTRCNVLAIEQDDGMLINPDGDQTLPRSAHLVLIGDHEGERRFFERHPSKA